MAAHPRILSLCSGYGGLDHAVSRVFPDARTVCMVEREAFAAACLVAQMEEGTMAQAPIWSDLFTFDATAWRGCVDLVVAGFPCQPVSHAGRREAQADARWIWPRIADVIRDCGAGSVFLENVPGLLSANGGSAHEEVQASLAEMGFDSEWGCVSAAQVGATHKRERWFCLAYRRWSGHQYPPTTPKQGSHKQENGLSVEDRLYVAYHKEPGFLRAEECADDAENPDGRRGRNPTNGSVGLAHGQDRGREAGAIFDSEAPSLGRLDADGRYGDVPAVEHGTVVGRGEGRAEHAVRCWGYAAPGADSSIPYWPPGPDDLCLWRDVLAGHPELAPALGKEAQPGVRGVAHARATANRHDRLRLLGNGVVIEQAAVALSVLHARAVKALQSR